jgi:hypothetical protein
MAFQPARFINTNKAITVVGTTITSQQLGKALGVMHHDSDFNYVSVKRFLDQTSYRLQKINRYLATRGIRVVQKLDSTNKKISFIVERIERNGAYVQSQATLSKRAMARHLSSEAGAASFRGRWKNLTKTEAYAVNIPYKN